MSSCQRRSSSSFRPFGVALSSLLLIALPTLLLPSSLRAQDEINIASVALASPGQTLLIPIYGRDLSGTALGGDAGFGRTSQSLSLSLDISPAKAVAAVTLERAGLTLAATPIFATTVDNGTVHSAILAFDEAQDPLVFTLDPPFPGDLVATLELVLDPGFDQGVVSLTPVAGTTALGATAGSVLETVANGQLALVGGSVYVDSSGLFADGFESGDVAQWSGAMN